MNLYCASCHGITKDNLVFWDAVSSCAVGDVVFNNLNQNARYADLLSITVQSNITQTRLDTLLNREHWL